MEFDDFIFSNRLEKKLKYLDGNPHRIITPLLFHGGVGTGKTSFAKYFGQKHASSVTIFDGSNENRNDEMVDYFHQSNILNLDSIGDDKQFGRAIIVDEFHDLTPKKQDKLKVIFQDNSSNSGNLINLIILCLNTSTDSASEALTSVVTKAIRSRCNAGTFCFTPEQDEDVEVIRKIQLKYPNLDYDFIVDAYPDLRMIVGQSMSNKL
jgi:replication-associated recombination protein RarA